MSTRSANATVPDTPRGAEGIAIVLAGREAAARSHLTRLLTNERDMSVIAEASHLAVLRRQVREHRPDVVVLGLDARRLPTLDGLFSESEDTRYVVMNIDHGPEQDALPDAIRLATSRERTRRRSC